MSINCKWQILGNGRQWGMTDNVEWQTMGNYRQWGTDTDGKQWVMTYNGGSTDNEI